MCFCFQVNYGGKITHNTSSIWIFILFPGIKISSKCFTHFNTVSALACSQLGCQRLSSIVKLKETNRRNKYQVGLNDLLLMRRCLLLLSLYSLSSQKKMPLCPTCTQHNSYSQSPPGGAAKKQFGQSLIPILSFKFHFQIKSWKTAFFSCSL